MNRLYEAQGQARLWLLFAAAGVAAGALTDLILCFFGRGRLRAAGGIIAGAAFAMCVFGACLLAANGNMRAYMPLTMAAGAGVYRATIGLLLHRFCGALGRFAGRVLRRMGQCGAVQRLLK